MTDPLEERLRRLHPSPLPPEMEERLTDPPLRGGRRRSVIVRVCFGAAAAAAAAVVAFLLLRPDVTNVPAKESAPVLAETSARRVEDVRPLAVLAEGQRAWELVEVKWVDENTMVSTSGEPLAVQISHTHRTLVPVEIMLD